MPVQKDHIELICSIGELAGLFKKTAALEDFLQAVAGTIAWHMRAAVCSVYLFDEKAQEVVLTASQGLNPEMIGRLRLKLGEGLCGKALQELRPIRESNSFLSPYFKFVPGSYEERYKAFLAVPILRGLDRLGVLVVQDPVEDYFDANDTRALQAIAAQLSTTIENANLLMSLREKEPPAAEVRKSLEQELAFQHGTPVSSGIARGGALILNTADVALDGAGEPGRVFTVEDFTRALARTEDQLEAVQRRMEENFSDVASLIFSAHLLMVKDKQFHGDMLARIRGGTAPRDAIIQAVSTYARLFAASPNPRLREKVQDLKDVGRRLLMNLEGSDQESTDYLGRVVVAAELLPYDLVKLLAQRAEGVLLIGGGVSAHVAILARALQIPMVIADDRRYLDLKDGARLLLDGSQGTVYLHPGPEVEKQYAELAITRREAALRAGSPLTPAATADGMRIELLANINLLSELPVARVMSADGVGLYRSEFPFIVRNEFPSEEEQVLIYRKILDEMQGRPVTFRTLDVGGDKMLSYFPAESRANPFLGLRAIRFSLKHRHIFDRQLRALLRAGAERELRIMFPMVSSLDEFIAAREAVRACAQELAADGIPQNSGPKLGVMIELPSAVEIAEELAAAADFISIGSNDLVQHMLAVDRTNEDIADLYTAHHPAVLRALKRIVAAAVLKNKPCCICGEMASDERYLPFLIGIGLRSFSVEVRALTRVHAAFTRVNAAAAAAEAGRLLKMSRVSEVATALGIRPKTA